MPSICADALIASTGARLYERTPRVTTSKNETSDA